MYRIFAVLILVLFSQYTYAVGFSFLSSGKDISIGVWSKPNGLKATAYGSLFGDFEDYQNGSLVSICRDGSVSGSFGSGTCSSHGGVRGVSEAVFGRVGATVGLNYKITDYVEAHGGFLWALYYSNIDIGETGALNYNEFGVEVGFSLRPVRNSTFRIVFNYQTDQKRTMAGIRF